MSVPIETLARETSGTLLVPPHGDDGIGTALFDRYATGEHGQWQALQPLRYEASFGNYGRQQMLADLGPDVHPLQHMPMTERSLTALLAHEAVPRN